MGSILGSPYLGELPNALCRVERSLEKQIESNKRKPDLIGVYRDSQKKYDSNSMCRDEYWVPDLKIALAILSALVVISTML